jgi:hypothetical protein
MEFVPSLLIKIVWKSGCMLRFLQSKDKPEIPVKVHFHKPYWLVITGFQEKIATDAQIASYQFFISALVAIPFRHRWLFTGHVQKK